MGNARHAANRSAMPNASYNSRSAYGSHGARGANGQPAYSASPYSREHYGSGSLSDNGTKHARKRGGRAVRIVLGVLLVVLLAVGGAAFWYASQLDKALSGDADEMSGVEDALVPIDPSQPFYVLLLGSDSREGGYSPTPSEQGDNQRSDVIILARIDAPNKVVTLVSVPRDTPYELEDGTIVKINEMYNREGAAGSIRAVSKVTGVPISHFATVGFADLEAVVDLLGGVEVTVDTELSYWDVHSLEQVTLYPGTQTISGQQAQIFARARHEYGENQEAHRQNNVRSLLTAIIKKTLDRPATEIPGIILKEAEHVTTDVRTGDLVSLALAFGADLDSLTMYSATGPSNGDFVEYLDGMWLCYRNPEGWAQLMAAVETGQDPSGMDYSATQQLW